MVEGEGEVMHMAEGLGSDSDLECREVEVDLDHHILITMIITITNNIHTTTMVVSWDMISPRLTGLHLLQ
jgi:hypothetical protein